VFEIGLTFGAVGERLEKCDMPSDTVGSRQWRYVVSARWEEELV
jgi:hypothetical protein